jgi:hypothetical protein
MNITSADFVNNIVVDILKKNITLSDSYYDLGASKNVLIECVKRNKGIGKKPVKVITNLIINSTKYDSNKRKMVIEYLKKCLSEDELQYLEENKDDIATIVKYAAKRVSDRNKLRKNVFNDYKKIDKDFYSKSIINDFDKFNYYLEKDTSVALALAKKLIKSICKIIFMLENNIILSQNSNIVDCILSNNIVPNNIKAIITSLNNINSIEDEMIDYYKISFKLIFEWFLGIYLNYPHEIKFIKGDQKKTNLKVVDMYELISMGWTIKDYIIEVYKAWGEIIDNFEEEHKEDQLVWEKIVLDHMESRKVLMNEKNEFVGYWNFDPLFDEIFNKAKDGKLIEGGIKQEDIPYFIPGEYNLYFENIFINSNYQKTSFALKKILISILDTFEEMAQNDVYIKEICVWGFTDNGKALCKSLGLKYRKDHIEEGEIYCGTMKELLNHPICKDRNVLKNLYKNI